MEVTVLIDNREKKPLSFPTHLVVLDRKALPTSGKSRTVVVRTQPQTLKTGDYRLVGGTSAIERKGSFAEIANNCLTTDGRRRFLECCRRLRDECRTACILFEGQVGGFEVPLSGGMEPMVKYHPDRIRGLTSIPLKRGGGHCMPGSLTGAVSSKRVTEERKGWLSAVGNRTKSAKA